MDTLKIASTKITKLLGKDFTAYESDPLAKAINKIGDRNIILVDDLPKLRSKSDIVYYIGMGRPPRKHMLRKMMYDSNARRTVYEFEITLDKDPTKAAKQISNLLKRDYKGERIYYVPRKQLGGEKQKRDFSVINFGKHSGKTLSQLVKEKPDYVFWMWENSQEPDSFLRKPGRKNFTKELEKIINEPEMQRYIKTIKNDVVPFGKYKGMSVYELAKVDLSYLEWLRDKANIKPALMQEVEKAFEQADVKKEIEKKSNRANEIKQKYKKLLDVIEDQIEWREENGYDTGFYRSLMDRLGKGQDIAEWSEKMINAVRDMYAKFVDGKRRRGTKAYNAKLAEFDELVGLQASLIANYIELAASRRKLMYHGTTSKFIRPILKKGLGYGKQRVWDADKGRLESFGGVYLTVNFMTAHSAAWDAKNKFGGNELMIVSDVNLDQDTAIDEDSILPEIKHAVGAAARNNKYNATHLQSTLELLKTKGKSSDYAYFLDDAYEAFKKDIIEKVDERHKKRAAEVMSKNDELIMELMDAELAIGALEMIEREGDYYIKQWYDINSFGTPPEWIFDYSTRKMKTSLKEFRTNIFRPLLKNVTDIIGRLMRGFTERNLSEISFNHVRVPNVGYKGARKIVLIIEEIDPPKNEHGIRAKEPKKLIIRYNKSNAALKQYLNHYKQHQGENYELIK